MLRTLTAELTLGHGSSSRNKVGARTELYQVPLPVFTLPADDRLAY